MDDARYQSLVEDDLNHWVHPLFHSSGHQQPLLIERGEGVYVYGADGTRYIDGLAALWNVAVGHGRAELGEAAAAQMAKLGFNNSYEGYTNEPAIRLAKKVVGLAYPNMQALYFTTPAPRRTRPTSRPRASTGAAWGGPRSTRSSPASRPTTATRSP